MMNWMFMGNLLMVFLSSLSMILLYYMGYLFIMDELVYIEWNFIMLNSIEFSMMFLFDWMSMFFISYVMFISSMVMLYSKGYMENDKNVTMFYLMVFMFILSMLMLILSMNLFWLILGWDMLGVVSYLLVIYYDSVKSMNAGMVTILMNRVGDVGIFMSLVFMMKSGNLYFFMNELEWKEIFMLLMAGMTKSSQIPFSVWLPMAMAAPTPVSALVHSSTLVTAGVYLVIRMGGIQGNLFILIFISITMFISGMVANVEMDLKKIVAMSTMSQLSFMFFIMYLGFLKLAFFHLLIHAMFKSLMFLSVGMIIHYMGGNQDIRFMGGLSNFIPNIFVNLNLSVFCLCGMVFLSGFYSKDKILEEFIYCEGLIYLFMMFFFSVGLTVMYSLRLMYYSFLNEINCNALINFEEVNMSIELSMIGLLIYSIFSGWWVIKMLNVSVILSLKLKLIIYFNLFMFMVIFFFLKILEKKMNMLIVYMMDLFGKMSYLVYLYKNLISLIYLFSKWGDLKMDKGSMLNYSINSMLSFSKNLVCEIEFIFFNFESVYLLYSFILVNLYLYYL
uniref:NADH dehydrogenase subunit 5 n=1 Tax=Sirex nitobei TaxID=1602346 RepID=UPI0023D88DA7|nr:NADH dehydrogenase subunit 5 [Sirex nitobei]WDR47215.1 NADH dehydrogenase subunit 5 [Sirex nitobei]